LLDRQIARANAGKQLSWEECKDLCERVRVLLLREPNVVSVSAPVTIVGDIKGQFLDLLNVLEISGPPPEINYVFLGNYVCRGYNSCSCISLLFLLKSRYPERITLLRGNFENRHMTQTYGFYDECIRHYGSCGEDVYRYYADCFDCLPLAAVVNDQVLCVHSGLSPALDTMDQIQGLNRFGDVPADGAITDLLWSDPDDLTGWGLVGRTSHYSFGQDITEEFLTRNNLTQMFRSHQLVQEGYNVVHEGLCVTIFSAANFVGRCQNQGAVMELDDSMCCSFKQFDAVSKQKPLCGHSSFDSSRSIPAHFTVR